MDVNNCHLPPSATDKRMATAPQGFCRGSCDPVDCMPIKKRILSSLLSTSEKAGTQKTHSSVYSFFFFNGEEKYLFSNLDALFIV